MTGNTSNLPGRACRILISVNPMAGRRAVTGQLETLVGMLRGRGYTVEVFTSLDEVASQANALHSQGELHALVAVGGDGTVAELVNRTQPGVPLAVFPAGTANVLAKQFGLESTPEHIAETITRGNRVQLDAGCAGGRLFLVMVSCGIDAEVVGHLHQQRKAQGSGHIHYGSYFKPILKSVRSYHYPKIRVYCDEPCDPQVEGTEPITAHWVCVSNFPRYGWGLPVAPAADASDGLFDVHLLNRPGFFRSLWFVLTAQVGLHEGLPGCQNRRARRLRMTSDEAVPYQLDGDPGGALPVDVEILPGRFTLIVPAAAVASSGDAA